MSKSMYLVMKINKTVTVNIDGKKSILKIKGIDGFIPVYENKDKADREAKGKYDVLSIKVKE